MLISLYSYIYKPPPLVSWLLGFALSQLSTAVSLGAAGSAGVNVVMSQPKSQWPQGKLAQSRAPQ